MPHFTPLSFVKLKRDLEIDSCSMSVTIQQDLFPDKEIPKVSWLFFPHLLFCFR